MLRVFERQPKWKVVPTFTLWLQVNLFRNLALKCELRSSCSRCSTPTVESSSFSSTLFAEYGGLVVRPH